MLTAERLRELLSYDAETGVFTNRTRRSPRALIGQVAGCVGPAGYRLICLDSKLYYAHRLAVLYVTGVWPEDEVDHENVTPGDDRWTNLRAASSNQNKWNTKQRSNNTSGYKGVTWSGQHRRWAARITVRRRNLYLGLFDDPKSAHAAYVAAAEKHFGEFARSGS